MQFLLRAHDFTDEQALERRMAARPFHFETARKLKSDGHFVIGGAVLNDAGQMIGSMMVVDFPNETALQTWLQADPYVTQGVWDSDSIEIKPFRVADV
ncbi:MAG: hypothetical protein H7Y12_08740 [Sphingobacteriaceae bacterium]|nr:hypothetical protein [Cytophagaceae bacterium]